jgi:hypothetical protein
MRKAILLVMFFPVVALAADKPALLTDDEANKFCAEALPKHLACKEEFCTAMVDLRLSDTSDNKKGDPSKKDTMHAKCLEEVATDGAGDLDARTKRCAGWAKDRGQVKVSRADADAVTACWSQKACSDQIACWKPKMAKIMTAGLSKP